MYALSSHTTHTCMFPATPHTISTPTRPHHARHPGRHIHGGRTFVGISRVAEMWRFKLSPPCEDCPDQLSTPMTAAQELLQTRTWASRAKLRCGGSGGVIHSVVIPPGQASTPTTCPLISSPGSIVAYHHLPKFSKSDIESLESDSVSPDFGGLRAPTGSGI